MFLSRVHRNLLGAAGAGVAGLANLFGGIGKPSICFLKGTRISTIAGERPVEQLEVGSQVPAMFGGLQPIQEITRQVVRKIDGARHWQKHQMLVRIRQGALAADVPRSDLFVTRGHAIHIDGVLVPAVSLVNGTTVTLFAPEGDEYEIYHFKLENHDVVRAEGAPCETEREWGSDEACLPVVGFKGYRGEIASRLRSALSPWVDRRGKAEILRDYLEEHGVYEARPFSG